MRFAYILLCLIVYLLQTIIIVIWLHEIFLCIFFYAIWGMARLEINLWRSWQAAISLGEEHASFEPGIAEWDSYCFLSSDDPLWGIGNLLNWNILVGRGRENNCDAVSNVERKRFRTNWILLGNLGGDVVL